MCFTIYKLLVFCLSQFGAIMFNVNNLCPEREYVCMYVNI